MSLKNEVLNAGVIEEREGIRALSTTELGWVSGGNGKKKGGSDTSKEASTAMSEIISEISEKLSISGKIEVTVETRTDADGSEETKVTVTLEVSTGGKGN